MKKRGKELAKLDDIMTMLAREDALPPSHHAHRLAGEYRGHGECHIESDWLLIWYTTEHGHRIRSHWHARGPVWLGGD